MSPHESEIVAAVDLGSNSFHMIVARAMDREPIVIDRLRDPVRLGGGLQEDGSLSEDAQLRAIASLKRFAERLRGHPRARVRAVGTNTFRKAKNSRRFVAKCEAALGFPIEVIAGREEARLIYLGVAHTETSEMGRRLVVDIGGGSTECILGEGFEALQTESLDMGCVAYSQRFFGDGRITREGFRDAELAARREVQTMERQFRTLGWESCLGASGTITAIAEVAVEQGWSKAGISRASLRLLKKELLRAERIDAIALKGLKADRAAVLPGGLSILRAIFDALEIKRMHPASGALREGVLYDLLGRLRHEDGREATVRRFCERLRVDLDQAARVERTAAGMLRQVTAEWQLSDATQRQMLTWAARVHEAGMVVSYSGYQKHGAYLLQNSDLAGFSTDEQEVLAAIVRGHRRRLDPDVFSILPPTWVEPAFRLSILLRLAVVLNRARSPRPLPTLRLAVKGERGLSLTFPPGWIEHHSLVEADLEEERDLLSEVGITLEVVHRELES